MRYKGAVLTCLFITIISLTVGYGRHKKSLTDAESSAKPDMELESGCIA